jgi:hypothetical protein
LRQPTAAFIGWMPGHQFDVDVSQLRLQLRIFLGVECELGA